MHPCFTFCRILGIFPYRINASTFETTKQRCILTTIIIGILCIYELGILCRINIIGTIKFNIVALTFERNCFFTLSGFIMIVTYILNDSRMHLLQNIMEISLRLPPDSYRKLSKLIHAKDIFGFFFLIGQTTFYQVILEFNNMDKIFVLYMNLIILQMDMLYINCVCVLKACFKEINDNLTNLGQVIMNDKPHLLRRLYHEQRNPFLLMKLKALRKQHLITSDAVQMLNTIFSLQLLATIVITFVELTFFLYFYIFHWKIDANINHKGFDWLLLTSLMYQCIKIVLIGWACDTGKDEAMGIGTTVHEILNDTNDEQIDEVNKIIRFVFLHFLKISRVSNFIH